MRKLFAHSAVLSMLFVGSVAWGTLITYDYLGLEFSEFTTGEEPNPWVGARLSGSFTIDTSLLPNQSIADVTYSAEACLAPFNFFLCEGQAMQSFSFTDGFMTMASVNVRSGITFNFSTDAQGDLLDWYIELLDGPPDFIIGSNGDFATLPGDSTFATTSGPGTWTRQVPEPGMLALLLFGGLGLMLFRRSAKQA